MKAVVLIPCYKPELTPDELVSLRQCRSVLAGYDCKVFLPEGLGLPDAFDGMESTHFPASYFTSVEAYSRLMLSLDFYDRFKVYDYMLIYQLDAYVFRDELDFWCVQGFDYIGAPWGDAPFLKKKKLRKSLPLFARTLWFARLVYRRDFRVGNGGLSLRCIQTFRSFLHKQADAAKRWTKNEDLFWALAAPVYDRRFHIPPEVQAMRFAVELNAQQYFDCMEGKLPFGCHAWRKHDPEFWTKHIPFIAE